MKRILFIALSILLMSGVAFAAAPGRDTSPGHGDILGQGGLPSQPHKIFRLVRWVPAGNLGTNAIALTADSVVIWDLTSDDGITVTTSTTSGDNAVAGIIAVACLTPETLGRTAVQDSGKRNWTWLQTYGLASVAAFNHNSVGSAGAAFGCSDQVGLAGLTAGVTTGIAEPGSCGFVYDAVTAAATDVEVFLKCD